MCVGNNRQPAFLIRKMCVQKKGMVVFLLIKLLLQYERCVFKKAGAAF